MIQLSATLEVVGNSVQRANVARRLKDDLEMEKLKSKNLETRASNAEKALADEQQKTRELKDQHK